MARICPSCSRSINDDAAFCQYCGTRIPQTRRPINEPVSPDLSTIMYEQIEKQLQGAVEANRAQWIEINNLKHAVEVLEIKIKDVKPTSLPKTNLLSDDLAKRAIAVFGHGFLGQLLLLIPIAFIYFILTMLLSFSIR